MPAKNTKTEIYLRTTRPDPSGMYVFHGIADEKNPNNNMIHCHSFWEMEFIVKGSGRYEINNRVFPIGRGWLYLTTPADYHYYSLDAGEQFELYNIQFFSEHLNEEILSFFYSRHEPIAVPLDGGQFDWFCRSFEETARVFSEKAPMYGLMVRNLIENICVRLAGRMSAETVSAPVRSAVKDAVIFAKDNYRDNITLHDAALRAGMSEAYFSHMFSSVMGIGFSAYLRNIRLNAAANLLKSTNMSIKEVCYETGFGNRSHFTKVFREQFGLPPAEYQKKYRLH